MFWAYLQHIFIIIAHVLSHFLGAEPWPKVSSRIPAVRSDSEAQRLPYKKPNSWALLMNLIITGFFPDPFSFVTSKPSSISGLGSDEPVIRVPRLTSWTQASQQAMLAAIVAIQDRIPA